MVFKRHLLVGLVPAVVLALVARGGGTENVEEEGGSEAGGGRTVEHAPGENEVPENPQRIVSPSPGSNDGLLAPGAGPITLATFTGTGFESYSYLAAELEDAQLVGTFIELKPELVAAEPDLIIGSNPEFFEESLDRLSRIAPTVILSDREGDFRRSARRRGRTRSRTRGGAGDRAVRTKGGGNAGGARSCGGQRAGGHSFAKSY